MSIAPSHESESDREKAANRFGGMADAITCNCPTSPMSFFFYTLALGECPSASRQLLASLHVRRAKLHLAAENPELAEQDAAAALLLDPHSASTTRMLRTCRRACEAGSVDNPEHTAFRFGGPKRGSDIEEWFKEKGQMIDLHSVTLRLLVKHDGDIGKFVREMRDLGYDKDGEGEVRNFELLRGLADLRMSDSCLYNRRSQSDAVAGIAKDLVEMRHPLGTAFRPTEFLHHIGQTWTDSQKDWWWKHMSRCNLMPGEWTINLDECWRNIPEQWRLQCMRRALIKICREYDCLEFSYKTCPEVSAEQLVAMSVSPSIFEGLVFKCVGSTAEQHFASTRWLRIPDHFWRLDTSADSVQLFRSYAKLVLQDATEELEYIIEDHVWQRWHFLVCFCFYTSSFMICKNERIIVRNTKGATSRQKAKERTAIDEKWGLSHPDKHCRRVVNGLAASAADSENPSVKRDACEHCGAPNAIHKCSRCLEMLGRRVIYCRRECQEAHWPKHKSVCGKHLTDVMDKPQSELSSSQQYSSTSVVPSNEDVLEAISAVCTKSGVTPSLKSMMLALRETNPAWQLSQKRLSQLWKRDGTAECAF